MAEQEQERGDIVIPSQEWVEFKEKVREGYNAEQERRYRLAIRAYEMTLQEKAGRDGIGWKEAGRRVLERLDLEEGVRRAVHRAMYRNGPTKRPLKPRKLDFPLANNRTTAFALHGGATIAFENDTRTVSWSVPGRPEAVESVRRMPAAEAFFGALDAIGRKNAWTDRSGGEITRTDEDAGPSADVRVVARYGPRVNRENTARYGDSPRW